MRGTTKALEVLMRDYGFRVEGNVIIENGIRGFTSSRVFRHCRSVFDAAEQLIPVICDSDYSARFGQITKSD